MNKILVVDDDANIRRLVGTILNDVGFDVCEASDGRDALQKLGENKIDICIVDIMMPNMDGFEAAEELRCHGNPPIVFLTAHEDSAFVSEAKTLGALGYVLKRASLAVLVLAIRSAYAGVFYLGPDLKV